MRRRTLLAATATMPTRPALAEIGGEAVLVGVSGPLGEPPRPRRPVHAVGRQGAGGLMA